MTSGTRIETAAILASARQARSEANAADTRVLVAAVEWARLHETTDTDLAATWGDTPVLIAGPGTPLIAKFAISEFASVVGMSSEGGKGLIAEAMELAHRLPLTWSRVLRGRLAAWRARRIAASTMELSIEAAAYVDQQVVSFAHRVGLAELQRLVNAAIAQFMPEFAAERAADAAEGRFFTVDHRQISFAGTSQVYGELDLADAIDLDRAVQHGADQLAELGSTDSVNVRRAIAVGHLARGDVSLGFPEAETPAEPRQARRPMRDLVLYLHLNSDPTDPTAVLENCGTQLLTKEQVAIWCGAPESRITIKPVVDLAAPTSTTAYDIPDRIREVVVLRDGTCVFPHCSRPARSCDLDHITPYPHGPTSAANLAPLCRHHHRLKTLGGWSYSVSASSTTGGDPPTGDDPPDDSRAYVWRSPHGYSWITDRHGTEMLTEPLVEPPGGAVRLDGR